MDVEFIKLEVGSNTSMLYDPNSYSIVLANPGEDGRIRRVELSFSLRSAQRFYDILHKAIPELLP